MDPNLNLQKAAYVDASQKLFDGNWHFIIAFITSIICIGTLNAWLLTSGQIILGLAQDNLMPIIFCKVNKYKAPAIGIITSSVGNIPMLCLTANDNFKEQILSIVDFSVIAFLFVYAFCCLAYFKLLLTKKPKKMIIKIIYTLIALIFCLWIIASKPYDALIASAFILSGLPMLAYLKFKKLVKK